DRRLVGRAHHARRRSAALGHSLWPQPPRSRYVRDSDSADGACRPSSMLEPGESRHPHRSCKHTAGRVGQPMDEMKTDQRKQATRWGGTVENIQRKIHVLEAYAIGSALVFGVLALSAFSKTKQKFDEISVERLNVV